MNFFRNRKLIKHACRHLRHCKHLRNMNEDVMKPSDLQKLIKGEDELREALKAKRYGELEKKCDSLSGTAASIIPPRPWSSLSENLEILVVAFAVAMAFRAYFVQPFKIPTGSMQPTLYGIDTQSHIQPGIMDRLPMKLVKWIVTGDWYREIRAKSEGELVIPTEDMKRKDLTIREAEQANPGYQVCFVVARGYYNVTRYLIPRSAVLKPGQFVSKNAVIWSGGIKAGDHVFVNKLIWNFRRPRLGEVMVFSTESIPELMERYKKPTHYIKRMCGCPGNTVSINPPDLMVNGSKVEESRTIARVERSEGQYRGYQLVTEPQATRALFRSPSDRVVLGKGEYLAFGDNTSNSLDSRYWGTVPERSLVGPAFFMYWPFNKRWGPIEGN